MHRSHPHQPYITFRMKLNNKEKVTKITMHGDSDLKILLAVLSLIGGLFTSIGSIVATIVKKLTKSDFITAVSKSLFLVHKLSTIKPTQTIPADENQKESDQKVLSRD